MRVLVQVVCSKGRSLRQAIVRDQSLDSFGLVVTEHKRQGRPHGWAKIYSTFSGRHGAINIEWDSDTRVLLCRIVTRGAGKSNLIIGDFVDYLIRRFSKRIMAINILPR
jgi:hypothetical protein